MNIEACLASTFVEEVLLLKVGEMQEENIY
jgi:hypothetical protein